MTFIEYSILEIKRAIDKDKNTVIRVELSSGKEAKVLKILSIGSDYIVGKGRTADKGEVVNFSHVVTWMFGDYNESEWKWSNL